MHEQQNTYIDTKTKIFLSGQFRHQLGQILGKEISEREITTGGEYSKGASQKEPEK